MRGIPAATDESALISRRRMVRAGGLSALGLALPQFLQAEEQRKQTAAKSGRQSRRAAGKIEPRAKSCILFFMEGAPSHIDLWDMKPEAPEQVRGIYQSIETSLPGLQLCEHLPLWAPLMHHMTVVRSVSHRFVDHNAGSYYTLTGQNPLRDGQLIRGPSPENAPPIGSVLSMLRPSHLALPDYVHIPKRMFNCGNFIPGVLAGFLGEEFDPFIAGDPSVKQYRVPGLQQRLAGDRFDRRRDLLRQMQGSFGRRGSSAAIERMETFYERAYSLITSPQARRAFNLDEEPPSVRERYGLPRNVKGFRGAGLPHLGQSMLLARRLVESGVRLVSVWAGGQAFDTHRNHFPSLTNALCPPLNQAFSALIGDLAERGLLDETLVVAMGEFGRTPKMGQITSSAGATPDGRDHWPNCYTLFLAGGGAKAGHIHGASDQLAAYPVANPVSPGDIAATIYRLLGIDPHLRIHDNYRRPHELAAGEAIADLMA